MDVFPACNAPNGLNAQYVILRMLSLTKSPCVLRGAVMFLCTAVGCVLHFCAVAMQCNVIFRIGLFEINPLLLHSQQCDKELQLRLLEQTL